MQSIIYKGKVEASKQRNFTLHSFLQAFYLYTSKSGSMQAQSNRNDRYDVKKM